MIMARVIILGIVVVVSMVVAYIFRNVSSSLLTVIQDNVAVTTFEAAIIVLIPYIVLVYMAIVRPVVDFWASRRS